MTEVIRNPGHEYFAAIPIIECGRCGELMAAHDDFVVVHLATGKNQCEPSEDIKMKRFIFKASDPSSDVGSATVVIIANTAKSAGKRLGELLEKSNRADLLPTGLWRVTVLEETTGVVYSDLEAKPKK